MDLPTALGRSVGPVLALVVAYRYLSQRGPRAPAATRAPAASRRATTSEVLQLQQQKALARAATFGGFVLVAVFGVWNLPRPAFLLPVAIIAIAVVVQVRAIVRLAKLEGEGPFS